MKKLILITLLMISSIFAANSTVKICKEKDYDCQYLPLKDVKKIDKIMDGEVLRVTFNNGQLLDIKVGNRYYEIKK